MLDKELLDILACPVCKTTVIQKEEALICKNPQCRKQYRIEDGIPVMLQEEATTLDQQTWKTHIEPKT